MPAGRGNSRQECSRRSLQAAFSHGDILIDAQLERLLPTQCRLFWELTKFWAATDRCGRRGVHAELPLVSRLRLHHLPIQCCQLGQREGARQDVDAGQLRGRGARGTFAAGIGTAAATGAWSSGIARRAASAAGGIASGTIGVRCVAVGHRALEGRNLQGGALHGQRQVGKESRSTDGQDI